MGQKPKDRAKSEWALQFIMQATTTYMRQRVRKYAVILDGLQQEVLSDRQRRIVRSEQTLDPAADERRGPRERVRGVATRFMVAGFRHS